MVDVVIRDHLLTWASIHSSAIFHALIHLKDLKDYNCDIVTIGQYLQPSKEHIELVDYIHPDQFNKYKETGMELGFRYVASAPLVRSSYNASEALNCKSS